MNSRAESRLALALEAAQLGTWTWDMAAGSTEWDVRLEQLHGLPPGGFGGTYEDWLAALHPDDRAECLARVERALAGPGPYMLLHRTTWPDGSIHWIECRGEVTVDANGAPTGTIGVAIDVTAREERDAVVAEELAQERNAVEAMQRALLPTTLPSIPGVSVAARYLPASGPAVIGGDWYAVIPLDVARLGLAIGDVAGHGLPAVADMAHARFSVRTLALTEHRPDRLLDRLDQVIDIFGDDTLVTALYGLLDPQQGTWTYASAGHCPSVLRSADGSTTLLHSRTGPPLGCGGPYRSERAQLPRGSTLVLYTDGLIERRGEPLDAGVSRLLAACAGAPRDPEALCDHLLGVLLGDDQPADDVAVLAATLH